MFATLGNTQFDGVKGFNDYSFKGASSLPEHALLFGKPTLQNTGNELDNINISIRLHVSFCNPSQEIASLNDSKNNAEILPLVWGNGSFAGNYVISEINVRLQQTDGAGNIFEAELALSLKEYVDPDPLGTKKSNAKNNAFALNNKNVTQNTIKNTITTPQKSVTNAIADGQAATGRVANAAKGINATVAKAQELSKKIGKSLDDAKAAFQKAHDILNEADTLKAKATTLYNNLANAVTTIQNLKNRLPITTGVDALALSDVLTNTTGTVASSASIIGGFLATQRVI